jgi:hypothetical protein
MSTPSHDDALGAETSMKAHLENLRKMIVAIMSTFHFLKPCPMLQDFQVLQIKSFYHPVEILSTVFEAGNAIIRIK